MASIEEVLDLMLDKMAGILQADWTAGSASDVKALAEAFGTLLTSVSSVEVEDDDFDDLDWDDED